MMLIDTHCHFNHDRFADDLDACRARAHEAGVRQMIVVGYDLPSSEQAVTLADRHPGTLFAAVAVHPHDAKTWNSETEARLRELAQAPGVVALGEIGLDFHYDFSSREDQFVAFRAQIALAQETRLPLIIHCREAYGETLTTLEEAKESLVGGVMHCWAGSVEEAKRTVELGFHLGFGGTLTFKNAENVRQSALAIPRDRVLLETDAPYLAPMPHRGKRNEPAYTRLVAERLAELYDLPVTEIAAITTCNANRLFPGLTQ